MKICLVSRYFSFRNAGLGRIAMEVSSRLEQRGHDVVKVEVGTDGLAKYAWQVLHGLRSRIPQDCDVYHALSPMEAFCLPKHKSVVTYNDLILLTHPKLAGAKVRRNGLTRRLDSSLFFFMAMTATRCRRLIAISDLAADDVADYLHVDRQSIGVVRLGIRPDLEPAPKADSSTFRIGYIGQLDPRKRVHLLIEAFAESEVDGELVIAGDGVLRDHLRALAGGDPRIRFLGEIPDDKLGAFYQSLDFFVFPTSVEGYGLPPVEAMACGVPVVVMQDAVIPMDVKRHCLQTEDLCGLMQVLSSLKVEGAGVCIPFAKSHDWETTVDAYEQVYREVAG